MRGYDIIGDVHGCASELRDRLEDLGYTIEKSSDAYEHEERTAIFVGDLIDRGPAQRDVLEMVKSMVDAGSAQVVMGNHEFNALAYATPKTGDNAEIPEDPGAYLRPHTEKNFLQHEAFLSQLTPSEQEDYLAWFMTMPLWLDLGEIRVVHACWHPASIALIERRLGGNRFTSVEQIVEAATRSEGPSSLYDAVEIILKGPELSLANYGAPPFKDKDGNIRREARIKWWKPDAQRVSEIAEVPPGSLDERDRPYGEFPDEPIQEADTSFVYADEVPVFYGHYWRSGVPEHLEDWTEWTACVDFSAVKGGTLAAYRWNEGESIDWTGYHPPEIVRDTPSD